jgi:hypothetical protein
MGSAIADFDNDGWPDLFYVTGSVSGDRSDTAGVSFRTPAILFATWRRRRRECKDAAV